jgi:hypothetical protein
MTGIIDAYAYLIDIIGYNVAGCIFVWWVCKTLASYFMRRP